MKKIMSIMLAVILVFNAGVGFIYAEGEEEAKKENNTESIKFSAEDLADNYVVMDAATGKVLFSANEHVKMTMGSMTAIMTSLIMLENHSLPDKIKSPENFTSPSGSSIAVDVGEEFTLEQLLHALLLLSANDAAKTLAIANAGSVDDFVVKMNNRAKALKMNDTNFVSVYNSENNEQLTSVYDIAIMLKELMKFAAFKTAISAKEYVIPPTNKKDVARNYIKQSNLFLLENGEVMEYMGKTVPIYDKNILESKLSTFSNGRYIIFTTANYNNMSLIFVSAGEGASKQAYAKQKALMEKAKNEYATYTIITKGQIIDKIKLNDKEENSLTMIAKSNVSVVLPKNVDVKNDVVREVKKRDLKNVVVEKDTKLGEVILKYQGKEIAKTDLVSESSTKTSSFLGELNDETKEKTPFEMVMSVAGFIIKVILIILIWTYVVSRRREKIREKEKRDNVSSMIDYKKHRK